jgi:predicted nucleic acid-binding protein
MALARTITETEAEEAINELGDMPIFRHPHSPLLQEIWSLRLSLTAYDAAYVALAQALSIPLFTCDAKLSRSHGHFAKVVLLE